MSGGRAPRPLRALTSLMLLLSAIAVVASWRVQPPVLTYQLAVLALATVLSENFAVVLLPGASVSLAYPLTIAAVVLQGPAAGALVAALSAVTIDDFSERRPLRLILFNAGQLTLIAAVGGLIYHAAGGEFLIAAQAGSAFVLPSAPEVLRDALALGVMALFCGAANIALAGIGIWAFHGDAPLSQMRELLWVLPAQVALAFVGYLIALVLSMSTVGFVLLVLPLVVARQFHQSYNRMRQAYVDTIRSLVGAVEAKDVYTRGHSERVAQFAMSIGRSMGLSAVQLDALEYAALLHDVGKLGISEYILLKPGRLNEIEFEEVRKHPGIGASMVEKVVALRGLADPIRHHHERFDGGGYPDGLRGEEIPVTSRILAVADAFDAMTSDRSYRPAMTETRACAELTRCSGTQFDPGIVAFFLSEVLEAEVAELIHIPNHAPVAGKGVTAP